jgi:SNF2 family DNA or RNA helicase
VLPELDKVGWRIEVEDSFPYPLRVPDEWYGDVEETQGGSWFDLELGVVVDGRKVSLLPLLASWLRFAADKQQLQNLRELPPDSPLNFGLQDGTFLMLPVGRVRAILENLLELSDPYAKLEDGRLRLPALRAAHLADLEDVADTAARWRWLGGQRLRELSERLRNFNGLAAVEPPRGFEATLRHYQQGGLAWLQFLREYGLGGVLADDMGLGKTVQTLAHLLIEKQSGRMDRPSLVIAPTSLMVNWQTEAQRFAPELRVLTLHGPDRRRHFENLNDYDLILTTYALLTRDRGVLSAGDYHLLILDEAQNIKNPRAQASQIVHELTARHRLCLTGTPMENHLGELWSLLHFLQPGLLGDQRQFRRLFRTPIEKHRDDERQATLSRRVAPFMLRRTKDEVAKELPPKTEIERDVELQGAQRDLYESIRVAVHDKVRKAIARQGMDRSQIVILDALLKLRQVCCDPRLVKLERARRVKESAKLRLLTDLLPEMVEEGRRILLFSQFTTMLGLIEEELQRRELRFVKLTGSTRDRATPIARFQTGEVPVFLISLKAGGTGLNLTAADTVIHYDPWWNPAVENQATDRAHRLGQEKPVFAYRLITTGTVEEKMIALQARKRELAEALFAEGGARTGRLSPDDLEVLFEPLAGGA